MAYKDILVYLDPTPASDARLGLAIALAKREGARLWGVDACTDEAYLGEWGASALSIGTRFEAKAKGLNWRYLGSGDRTAASPPDHSHCVDLIVASWPGPETRHLVKSFIPEYPLLNSGSPVLMTPETWKPGPVGEDIVIAWNASREAARAVHAALPLLQRARKATIFAFSAHESGLRGSAAMLADHLAQHGVTAGVSDWTNTGDIRAVDALFASLEAQNADLVVAGAYGHSRTFEALFGGVSIDLLREPSLPILMSH